MNAPAKADGLTRRDFASDQTVRWCPGCGDYAILAQIQKTLPELGVPRAPTLATGLKCARPELQIWVMTGDGDALAIGGNHLLHALRRNNDINIVLFNNRIYGLTKGQYSPTSEIGKRTKSSPDGSIENPMNPIGVAIGAEAGFIARTVDSFQEHMAGVLGRAAEHPGAAMIEIAQNCIIFNNGGWAHLTDPDTKADNVLFLEHGKPMRFGKAMQKGIRLNGLTPEVVNVADVGETELLVHDESATEPTLAYFLSLMVPPDFPTPVGIFRAVDKPVYDQQLMAQVQAARESYPADLNTLYRQSETWAVPAIALEGTKCPLCDHPNLPGADECELCLTSLTHEEPSAAEAQSRIEQSLREDSVEKLNPAGAVSVPESATVETALDVMREKRIGCVLATNTEGKLTGIFTERNALTRVAGEDLDPADTVVREVMTRDPETIKPDHPLAHALHLMVVGNLRYLPLVDEHGRPSGIIGSRDLIDHFGSLAMN
jgi:2-oxoglutarate ferredoxin oxidoreductase subunit beta